MKRNAEDNKLAQLLKENAHQAKPNEWFTPRVVNRLPESGRNYRRLLPVVYAIAFVACVVMCVMFVKNQDLLAVTVRDVLYFTVLLVVTLYVGCQFVLDIVHED